MSEQMGTEQASIQMKKNIADVFELQGEVGASIAFTLYRAVDKRDKSAILVALGRGAFDERDQAGMSAFVEKLKALDSLEPPLAEMLGFGVDAGGIPFALFPRLDGTPILQGNIESREAERRFQQALSILAQLHTNRFVCGDISPSSFWMERGGSLCFLGTLGLEVEGGEGLKTLPLDVQSCVAPECGSTSADMRSDNYAIAALGYHLFLGTFPQEDESLENVQVKFPGKVLPSWFSVLLRNLSSDPDARNIDAQDFVLSMHEAQTRQIAESHLPVKAGPVSQAVLTHNAFSGLQEHRGLDEAAEQSTSDGPGGKEGTRFGLTQTHILAISAGLLGAAFVALFLFRNENHQASGAHVNMHEQHLDAIGDLTLKEAVHGLADRGISSVQRQGYLRQIAQSTDPLSHGIFVDHVLQAATVEEIQFGENLFIEKLKRDGLEKTAEQFRLWLAMEPNKAPNEGRDALFRVAQGSLPIEARASLLRRGYTQYPRISLRLAAALAIDLNILEPLQPVLSQLIGDALKLSDAKQYSSSALILAHPDLSLVFGEYLMKQKELFSEKDIFWLLEQLAPRRDPNIRTFASLALEKGKYPRTRQAFFRVLRDRDDLPTDVVNALARAAAGQAIEQDIDVFGRWYDMSSEKVLLALLCDLKDEKLLARTFDLLAGKSLTVPPARELVQWLRDAGYWERRAEFARPIGLITMYEQISPDLQKEAFEHLKPYMKTDDLLKVLIEADNPTLQIAVLQRYGQDFLLGDFTELLESPHPEVRREAVVHMKRFNDVGLLRFVVDYYEREEDPTVRKAYEENLTVVQEHIRKR